MTNQREVLSADEWPAWIKTYVDTVLEERENHHVERFERLADRIAANKELAKTMFEAADEAVRKAETAAEKRFEAANEWRAQSADRERTMQEDRLRLEDKFMPREVVEKQYETLQTMLSDHARRLNLREGETTGARLTKSAFYTSLAAALGVLSLIVVIANYLAAH